MADLDPSWLPSTVAQSTAALVAIVGGFMVSRFITIDSEAQGARRRLTEAQERLRALRGEQDQISSEIVRREASSLLTHSPQMEEYAMSAQGEPPAAADILASDTSDLAPEELEPYLRDAIAAVNDARARLRTSIDPKVKPPTWREHRRAVGLPLDEWDDLREQVFASMVAEVVEEQKRRKKAERRAANPLGMDITDLVDYSALPVIPPLARYSGPTPWDRLMDRRDANRRDLATAEAEVSLATRAVTGVVQPGSLLWGLGVLTFLAAVGLVFPVIVLSTEPLASGTTTKLAVLYAFLGGVAALLLYLWIYALRLRSPISDPNDDTKSS